MKLFEVESGSTFSKIYATAFWASVIIYVVAIITIVYLIGRASGFWG